MFGNRNKARDAYTFSLGGLTAKTSFVLAPAVADDRINKVRDARLCSDQGGKPDTAREIEDFLAYYFAPGRRRTARDRA